MTAPFTMGPATPIHAEGARPGQHDLLRMARHARDSRKRIEPLFPKNLFRDSAWDMLLELFIATEQNERLCVKDLIQLSGDSSTSAIRRIDQLEGTGFLRRQVDGDDQRRVWVRLTEKGYQALAAMLHHLFDVDDRLPASVPRSFAPETSGDLPDNRE
jgi:DNA-binding MarR family transcriptional regulator